MDLTSVLAVCFIAFAVAGISVVVGGTSLITVPLLISLGMTSKNAIATNMFALVFLSISGAVGFKKETKKFNKRNILIFSILTICGSVIGANLILAINQDILRNMVSIVVCIIAGSFLFKKELGVQEKEGKISKIQFTLGVILIFTLGIYGGFFSGGYVTLLSYILILIFGLNFIQTAFITKILNGCSSLVACIIFYYHGLIDFSVGLPLAVSMSLGAFLGAKLAIAKGNLWIRNIFIIAVMMLAIKILFL